MRGLQEVELRVADLTTSEARQERLTISGNELRCELDDIQLLAGDALRQAHSVLLGLRRFKRLAARDTERGRGVSLGGRGGIRRRGCGVGLG